jgi:3-deoxy-7-phosphoheptulonate synthase
MATETVAALELVVLMARDSGADDVERVLDRLEEIGATAQVSPGRESAVIGIGGDPDAVRALALDALPGVQALVPVSKPYRRVSSETSAEPTVIQVRGRRVGGEHFALIAGPCTVESRTQTLAAARAVHAAGATMLRGGAFKPRTSPYSFRGLGEQALEILAEAREETGLPVVTEVLDPRQIEAVLAHADVLQIGARNMQNFLLLAEVGRTDRPVLLKRGPSASLDELLMAAEYVLSEGNPRVILCERGIRTFDRALRYTLDLGAIPVLKEETHLPVIVDPSHAAGRRALVPALARAAVAVGADGIVVEVDPDPSAARCDAPQLLEAATFEAFAADIRALARHVGRVA